MSFLCKEKAGAGNIPCLSKKLFILEFLLKHDVTPGALDSNISYFYLNLPDEQIILLLFQCTFKIFSVLLFLHCHIPATLFYLKSY